MQLHSYRNFRIIDFTLSLSRFFFLCLTILLITNSVSLAQKGFYWKEIQENQIPVTGERWIIPNEYKTLQLDVEQIKDLFLTAPLEASVPVQQSTTTILLPYPDGTLVEFLFVESPIMEPELAAKYPEMKTFLGQGITDPSATSRFDFTIHGFHAIIHSESGTIYIDPYSRGTNEFYISYFKRSFSVNDSRDTGEGCFVIEDPYLTEELHKMIEQGLAKSSGTQLRTYRTAIATTGEYTIFHGGTVQTGLAAVVTALNRVNGIYEKEVAVRMILVANNDLIIYTNPNTDPYTNNNGSTMLGQNQTNLDNVIGNANYDIGHVFSTGGGGVAGLGVVCRTSFKARGVTGLPQPIGDPFYVDYVAHEMGHQFAANHTFNTSFSSCSPQRNASTAYEPGSASTIMGYAGICGSHNIQNFSDDYFHGISFDEIVAFTTSSFGNQCPVTTPTGNSVPVVTVPTGGFTIPKGTPFTLTGSATDADNDVLSYNWEQFDLGPAGHPNSPSGNAPIFRSFLATSEPTRTFPRWTNIINNTQTIGEILPTYGRTLTFRLTARDNRSGGGGVGKASLSFSVTNDAGPFAVTSPNTNVTWVGNTNQTVTWNVAGTNNAPVNTANVSILLSTNGGQTFAVTIAESVPNNGSASINVPNLPTTQARIMVKGVNNIYFDISNVNFTIEEDPIPVELAFFSALPFENGVLLEWETVTEKNNAGFSIERKSENDFTEIAYLHGKGTTTEISKYSYIDNSVTSGKYTYRLKQIDFDGTFEYFTTTEVDLGVPAEFALYQNHPNPFNPSTVIAYQLPVRGHVTLKIYDILGKEAAILVNEMKEPGIYEVDWNASQFTSGVYFYHLQVGEYTAIKKLLLMK